MANDNISTAIPLDNVVAVCETVILETGDENLSRVIRRGVYTFTSFKEARHFATIVNAATETETAHTFTRNAGG